MRGRRAGQRSLKAEDVYGLTRRSLHHSCVNGPRGRDMYCVVHCMVGAVVATSSGALRRVVRSQSIREFRSYGLVRDSCQWNRIHWDRRLCRGGMVRLLQHPLCNGDHRCPRHPLTGTKRTPHLQVCVFLNSAESVVSRGWLRELSPNELYQWAESPARDCGINDDFADLDDHVAVKKGSWPKICVGGLEFPRRRPWNGGESSNWLKARFLPSVGNSAQSLVTSGTPMGRTVRNCQKTSRLPSSVHPISLS